MTKIEVRKKIKSLKGFYMDFIMFILGNGLFSLIWLAFDHHGTYWPKYTILVWGSALFIEAYWKGIAHLIFSRTSFLGPEWEDEKLEELLAEPRYPQRRIPLKREIKK